MINMNTFKKAYESARKKTTCNSLLFHRFFAETPEFTKNSQKSLDHFKFQYK